VRALLGVLAVALQADTLLTTMLAGRQVRQRSIKQLGQLSSRLLNYPLKLVGVKVVKLLLGILEGNHLPVTDR